jgi:hypothetical protein
MTQLANYEICQQALDAKKNIESRFIELGGMLHRIKEERLFEDGWTSWAEFEMELKLPSSTISRLIRIYQIFILRYQFQALELAGVGGWTLIAEYLPLIGPETPREEVSDWIGTASRMTRQDVRRGIFEAKTGISMDECAHENTFQVTVCSDCGDKRQDLT